MKRIWLFIAVYCISIGVANAAGRLEQSPARTGTPTKAPISRTATTATTATRSTGAINRQSSATTSRANARNATTTARSGTTTVNRQSVAVRSASTPTGARTAVVSASRGPTPPRTARATTTSAQDTSTFGTGYNTCRDAYFTCMDQFCAKQNESYRRCVCSSRLTEIQSRERALGGAADSLADFKNLNIDVIPKTAAEVAAMLTATAGESATAAAKDKSAAASQLAGISDVLSKTKKSAMSTQGQLDIAGDINAIWSTTDLTGGANIANLTGEALYNAVHAQCAEMMAASCPNASTQRMVVSAYGMYIENDCSTLINNLDKKLLTANTTIRETEREMQTARLENYDAHNATSINDCVASVRRDITADTACGTEFVHCLDVSGRYLNRDTGAPIYTSDFYQLDGQISLSGNILTNQTNRMIVAELQNKRKFAENSLKTCTDLADNVWDEFMRQAIREIYQGQQERIRQVKDECLDVVNQCYDEQSKSLKDFSNIKDQLLLGQRLELSEEMCREKLNACSNLYGDMDLLVTAMHNITNQKIARECRTTLLEYAKDLCAVPSYDTLHTYPFSCGTYTPGDQRYATIAACNEQIGGGDGDGDTTTTSPDEPALETPCTDPTDCPLVLADDAAPTAECGDYNGSLYQKLARYALNVCVRPSESDNMILPTTILQDVNVVMDQIRVDMAHVLAAECDRLGGVWVSTEWTDTDTDDIHDATGDTKFTKFYDETGANDKWGFCATKTAASDAGNDTNGDTTASE